MCTQVSRGIGKCKFGLYANCIFAALCKTSDEVLQECKVYVLSMQHPAAYHWHLQIPYPNITENHIPSFWTSCPICIHRSFPIMHRLRSSTAYVCVGREGERKKRGGGAARICFHGPEEDSPTTLPCPGTRMPSVGTELCQCYRPGRTGVNSWHKRSKEGVRYPFSVDGTPSTSTTCLALG